MRKTSLIKLLVSILVVAVPYVYFSNVSPFKADGSVSAPAVLVAVALIMVSLFLAFRVCMLPFTPKLANKLAFTFGFMVVQGLFLSSLGLLRVESVVLLIAFNVLVFWYLLQASPKT